LTKDPDGGDNNKPLTLNPYIYTGDNPVMNVDPDGNWHWHFTWRHSEHDIMIDFVHGRFWWYDRHFTKKRWKKYSKTKPSIMKPKTLAKRYMGKAIMHFPKSYSKRRSWHRHFDTTNAPLARVPLGPPLKTTINQLWGLKGWLFEKGTYRLPAHVKAAMGNGD